MTVEELFSASTIEYIRRTYGYLMRFKNEIKDLDPYFILAKIFINGIDPTKYQINLMKKVIHGGIK